jgi:hypothetical protein
VNNKEETNSYCELLKYWGERQKGSLKTWEKSDKFDFSQVFSIFVPIFNGL